jgi:hypothetical protein
LPFHTGFIAARDTPRIATFRRVDDRREEAAADAAQARDREGAALHVAGLELAVARQLGDLRQLARDVEHALAVGVAHHRHDQAAGVSTATPMWKYFLMR